MISVPLHELSDPDRAALDAFALRFQLMAYGAGDPHFPRVVLARVCRSDRRLSASTQTDFSEEAA